MDVKFENILKTKEDQITYTFIISAILLSLLFSTIIYYGIDITAKNILMSQRSRIRRELYLDRDYPLPFDKPMQPRQDITELDDYFKDLLDQTTLKHIRTRSITWLIILNLIIYLFVIIASRVIAKKLVDPINKAMLEQKRFIADATHELKTPITALITGMEVDLNDPSIIDKQVISGYLSDVNDLQSLVKNLLDLEKISYQNIELEELDLKQLVNESVKRLKNKADIKDISINMSGNDSTINADYQLTKQLIEIILDNAIKFSKEKGNIDIVIADKSLSITDYGIGINAEDLDKIFNRFYTKEESKNKKITGYGLGLSIAKQIVDAQKFKINVKSEINKATTFCISFNK